MLHEIITSYTCMLHEIITSYTCMLHEIITSYTCMLHEIITSYTCMLHEINTSYTCWQVCSETQIGNDMIRGVSGGQKKRVTTGASSVLFSSLTS
jgi:hypothetical protein